MAAIEVWDKLNFSSALWLSPSRLLFRAKNTQGCGQVRHCPLPFRRASWTLRVTRRMEMAGLSIMMREHDCFQQRGEGTHSFCPACIYKSGGSPDPLPGSVSLLEWLKNSGRHFLTVTGSRKGVRADPDAYPDGERYGQGSGGSVPEGSGVQHPPSHHREALRIPHC